MNVSGFDVPRPGGLCGIAGNTTHFGGDAGFGVLAFFRAASECDKGPGGLGGKDTGVPIQ